MLLFQTWVANAAARLLAAELAGGNIISDRNTPSKDPELPVAHVTIGEDVAKAAGDPRQTGTLRFSHSTTLSVEVIDVGNNGFELKAKLAAHAEKVLAALLPNVVGWFTDGEGLSTIETTYEAPPEGGQVVGRVMIAFELLSRSEWSYEPVDLDDLEQVGIGIGPDEEGFGAEIAVPTE